MPHLAAGRALKARYAACLCAALPWMASAAMYKWVDEKGVTHYSESAPPGAKATRIELPSTPAPAAPKDSVESWKERDIEFRKRRLEKEQADDAAAASAKRDAAVHKAQCLEARRRVDILQPGHPVYRVNERGERVYMEDQERAAEIDKWSKWADTNCDSR